MKCFKFWKKSSKGNGQMGSAGDSGRVGFDYQTREEDEHLNESTNREEQEKLTLALFKAIDGYDIAQVKRLVSEGVNINSEFYGKYNIDIDIGIRDIPTYGSTPLIYAAAGGRQAIALYLIGKGALLDMQSQDGCTALMHAMKKDDKELVKALVKAGASLNMENPDGMTPLMYAISSGQDEMFKALVKAGANVNLEDGEGETALTTATSLGRTDMVKILVKADLNFQNSKGQTALMIAASGHGNIVKILLKNRAALDLQDREGETALMKAALKGHTCIMEALLDAGANWRLKNIDNMNAKDLLTQCPYVGEDMSRSKLLKRLT